MTKGQAVRQAVASIERALTELRSAKKQLRYAKSDQHVPLAVQIANIEELHEILAGPEHTAEIEEIDDAPDPEYDDCRWDSERIDSTKSILFAEHIAGR